MSDDKNTLFSFIQRVTKPAMQMSEEELSKECGKPITDASTSEAGEPDPKVTDIKRGQEIKDKRRTR